MSHNIPQYDDDSSRYSSKFPVTSLTARVVTLVTLVVSAAVLKTNNVKSEDVILLSYKSFHSYQ